MSTRLDAADVADLAARWAVIGRGVGDLVAALGVPDVAEDLGWAMVLPAAVEWPQALGLPPVVVGSVGGAASGAEAARRLALAGERMHQAARLEGQVWTCAVELDLAAVRITALAVAVREVAHIWAEVEEVVSGALRRVDAWAYAHPDRVEWLAGWGHRVVLDPLLAAGARAGLLSEGPEDLAGLRLAPRRAGAAPADLGALVAGAVETARTPGLVRVLELRRGDGSCAWLVQISGTQDWSPRAGSNPFDLTTDVRAMSPELTVAATSVHLALLEAQRSSGRDTSADPVLLAGPSLGGILAASVASDPTFRAGRNVVGVVTAGSPIGNVPMPESVEVVALEHARDLVPRLDGRPNPGAPHWHTLISDPMPDGGPSAASSHDGDLYAQTARRVAAQAVETPGPEAWEDMLAPFLADPDHPARVIVHDVHVERQWHNPAS